MQGYKQTKNSINNECMFNFILQKLFPTINVEVYAEKCNIIPKQ